LKKSIITKANKKLRKQGLQIETSDGRGLGECADAHRGRHHIWGLRKALFRDFKDSVGKEVAAGGGLNEEIIDRGDLIRPARVD
jgi:hypothetical protein